MARRVLIADDDDDMRELLRIVLLSGSYTVVGAAVDGSEALDMWRRERAHGICAVILDQRMPGLYGIDVASAIRAEDPDQKVILLSAYIDASLEKRAAKAGIAVCVRKEDVLQMASNSVLRDACPDSD